MLVDSRDEFGVFTLSLSVMVGGVVWVTWDLANWADWLNVLYPLQVLADLIARLLVWWYVRCWHEGRLKLVKFLLEFSDTYLLLFTVRVGLLKIRVALIVLQMLLMGEHTLISVFLSWEINLSYDLLMSQLLCFIFFPFNLLNQLLRVLQLLPLNLTSLLPLQLRLLNQCEPLVEICLYQAGTFMSLRGKLTV